MVLLDCDVIRGSALNNKPLTGCSARTKPTLLTFSRYTRMAFDCQSFLEPLSLSRTPGPGRHLLKYNRINDIFQELNLSLNLITYSSIQRMFRSCYLHWTYGGCSGFLSFFPDFLLIALLLLLCWIHKNKNQRIKNPTYHKL